MMNAEGMTSSNCSAFDSFAPALSPGMGRPSMSLASLRLHSAKRPCADTEALHLLIRNSRCFCLQSVDSYAIIGRDVGNLLRSSERPVSTTIQICSTDAANVGGVTVSLLECAGFRFETSPFPV